MGELQQLK